jgi:hypothetical protein
MFTMVSSVFQVFLQVFRTHDSNVSFVFRSMLHLNVLKLDRVLHLPPRSFAVSSRCQARADPTCLRAGAASETWAGRHRMRDGGSGAGVRTGASHALSKYIDFAIHLDIYLYLDK